MVNRFLLLLLFIFTSANCFAKVSAYLAARNNFGGIGAARIGYNAWEAGQFAPSAFGVNKKFMLSQNYYSTFGVGIAAPAELAILSGVGFNAFNFLLFGVRGELYAVSTTGGVLSGAGTLGISWNY